MVDSPTPPTPEPGGSADNMTELLNALVVATRDHERDGDSETLKRCLAAREAVDAAYDQFQRDAVAARAERDAELAKERRLWSEHNVRIVEATGIDVPVCGITPVEAVEQLKRERGELRQRVEQAEKAARVTIDECRRQGVSLGRSLANYAATMERERAERAEADAAAARAERDRVRLSLQQRVTQTRLHSESVNGNCTTACLASVFGGSIDEYDERIPFTPDWWNHVEAIFRERGYLVLQLSPIDGHPSGVCFVSGLSPRGVRHLCVMQDGVIAHDPHPSRAGLTEITDYWAVIPWTFSDAARTAAPSAGGTDA